MKPLVLADRSAGFWVRRVFTFPNLLTLVRIPLAALLWLHPSDVRWVLLIVAIAGLSDVVDGRLAQALRRSAAGPHFEEDQAAGAWLDPLCDKLFALSALSVLWYGFRPGLAPIALAMTRELIILPLVALYHLIPSVRQTLHFDFRADWLGKLTTVFQFSVAGAILLVPPLVLPTAILAGVTGLAAALHYVQRAIRAARVRARNSPLLAPEHSAARPGAES